MNILYTKERCKNMLNLQTKGLMIFYLSFALEEGSLFLKVTHKFTLSDSERFVVLGSLLSGLSYSNCSKH